MSQTETSRPEDRQVSVEGVERRSSVLAQGAASIRSRSGGQLSLDKILVTVGGILLPIGIGAIILGWYGVAHTSYGFEQNSYIVSGGLLGLGLVFTGGFAYVGSWYIRQTRTASREHRQTMRALERLTEENRAAVAATESVARVLAEYLGEPASPRRYRSTGNGTTVAGRRRTTPRNGTALPRGAKGGNSPITSSLVATKRGTLVHRPDCPIVATKGDLKSVVAGEPGYEPCRICAPPVG